MPFNTNQMLEQLRCAEKGYTEVLDQVQYRMNNEGRAATSCYWEHILLSTLLLLSENNLRKTVLIYTTSSNL
jgi:hypothetical protein